MNALPATPLHKPAAGFDIGTVTRALVLIAGGAMSALCLFAIGRAVAGFAPDLPHLRSFAVVMHIATVLPCVPLGAYVLLTTKGTTRHKQLGKVWVVLMALAATSALFIQIGGNFSWIHIFVPVTWRACWKIVSTARAGNIQSHKREILGLFFGALMIPGIFAFLGAGRLMNTMLLG